MLEELWLIPLGFIAGILGSIIGLGGGIIIVPVLTFMGFSSIFLLRNMYDAEEIRTSANKILKISGDISEDTNAPSMVPGTAYLLCLVILSRQQLCTLDKNG